MKVLQEKTCAGPLPDMPGGHPLRVTEVNGCPAMRSRLYSMGILPGTELSLCETCKGGGSVCVRVRQASLVLGETMARAVICRLDKPGRHRSCPVKRAVSCGVSARLQDTAPFAAEKTDDRSQQQQDQPLFAASR